VDIDQSARPTYAQKREGVTTGKTQKPGQKCNGRSLSVPAKWSIKNLNKVIVIALTILKKDIKKPSEY